MGMPQMFFYPMNPMMYYRQMMVPPQQNMGAQPEKSNISQNNNVENK